MSSNLLLTMAIYHQIGKSVILVEVMDIIKELTKEFLRVGAKLLISMKIVKIAKVQARLTSVRKKNLTMMMIG